MTQENPNKRKVEELIAYSETGRKPDRRAKRRVVLICCAVVLILGLLTCSALRFHDGLGLFKKPRTGSGLVPVTLSSVYDGDTIHVIMPDGSEETVRLLMIDAPESAHPDETKNTEEGRRAAAFLSEYLKKGQKLYLEYEDGTNNRDNYGRLLAFVWLHDSTSVEPSYIKKNMLNAIILSKGYAEFHLYNNGNPVNQDYRKVLEGIR